TTAGTRQSLVEPIEALLALPPARWLLDGLLPEAGVALMVAPPNVGKSTVALDWALRVATGSDWHGRAMQAGGVAYFAGEGRRGIGQRAAAWLASHDATLSHRLDLVTRTPPLSQPEGQRELAAIVAEARPRLVVVDTISSLWGGASEDDASAVAPFLASLQRMAEAAGCLFLLLHHERKPSAQPQAGNAWAAVRGSGAWVGSADAALSLSGPPEALQLATLKQRDGERLPPISLRLVAVALPNGGSSVVVVPGAEAPPAAEHEPRAEDAILAAMRLLGADGITLPGAMQAGGCAKSTAWRALNLLVSNGLADQFGRRGAIRWRVR
ncbi:MAG: AAA family ATPase, partial [Alphaproteobacteria bacterium]|nr:AAA family ATPase [Alphaproteobacteria bacterium]